VGDASIAGIVFSTRLGGALGPSATGLGYHPSTNTVSGCIASTTFVSTWLMGSRVEGSSSVHSTRRRALRLNRGNRRRSNDPCADDLHRVCTEAARRLPDDKAGLV